MWTRKAAFTFTGGIALILIGMMISNHQMMILGLAFIAFIVVNSWVSGPVSYTHLRAHETLR